MPHVQDEDEAGPVGVVPNLVLERVLEHQAAALLPSAVIRSHPQSGAGRHFEAEVAAEPGVGRTAVRRDMGARSQSGEIDEPSRVRGLDPIHQGCGLGAPLAVAAQGGGPARSDRRSTTDRGRPAAADAMNRTRSVPVGQPPRGLLEARERGGIDARACRPPADESPHEVVGQSGRAPAVQGRFMARVIRKTCILSSPSRHVKRTRPGARAHRFDGRAVSAQFSRRMRPRGAFFVPTA